MTEYLERDVERPLRRAMASMPVVAVTGMRQAGKSTLLQNHPALAGRRYVTLDDFASLEAARRDPESLLGDGPVTIDEAQRAPELFVAVKRAVDKARRPGRFLLSGSANFALLGGITESLAGRAIAFVLHPFSRRELQRRTASPAFLPEFFKKPALPAAKTHHAITSAEILRGGMPPVHAAGADAATWFRGFEQSYIERDVRSLAQVADLVAFRTLVKLAALRTGSILNQTELGRDARLNAVTAGRWLGIMEASHLLTRLPPFLSNRTSRVIKAPKIYLADSGIAAHVAGVTDLSPTSDEPMRGALLETYLAQNLASILSAHWPEARLTCWNISGRGEVDFVVEAGRDSLALEVKSGTRWNDEDLRELRTFLAATPRCRAGVLVHGGESAVKLGDRLWALPAALVIS